MFFQLVEADNGNSGEFKRVEKLAEPDAYMLISRKLAKAYGINPRELRPLPKSVVENVFLATKIELEDDFDEKSDYLLVKQLDNAIVIVDKFFEEIEREPEDLGFDIEECLNNDGEDRDLFDEDEQVRYDFYSYGYYEAPRELIKAMIQMYYFETEVLTGGKLFDIDETKFLLFVELAEKIFSNELTLAQGLDYFKKETNFDRH